VGDITFRALAEDDLALLYGWLSRPHVRKWYAREPTSFAEVAAKYRSRLDAASAVKAFIIESGAAAVGYVQAYPVEAFPQYQHILQCEAGVVAMDLFLGDAGNLDHGLGARAIGRFVEEQVFAQPQAVACVAGPHEGDRAAIRAFEKAGFRRWRAAINEHGERECVLRRERDDVLARIEPIDLRDAATCVRFRRDMYVIAFGTVEGLEEEMGAGDAIYLDQLREKLAEWPEGNVHLWREGRIVGQLEMRTLDGEPQVGYVSLLHVAPDARGHGLGRRLHRHAAEVARHSGKRRLRLSVSLANTGAIEFYRRLGWRMAGPREHRWPMAFMEFPLE
jgi:ribosomal protein S18 acetylase RimI-like enzyme